MIRTLLAATALTAPVAVHAQSMPGMDMGAARTSRSRTGQGDAQAPQAGIGKA